MWRPRKFVDNIRQVMVTLPESRRRISNPNRIMMLSDKKDFEMFPRSS